MTGESVAMIAPTVNIEVMNLHLQWISRQLGQDRHAVLVLDQSGSHRSRSLQVPANITLLHLSPYSPELAPHWRLRWSACGVGCACTTLSNRRFEGHDEMYEAATIAFTGITEDRHRSICRTD